MVRRTPSFRVPMARSVHQQIRRFTSQSVDQPLFYGIVGSPAHAFSRTRPSAAAVIETRVLMADRCEYLTVREVMVLLRPGRTTVYAQARLYLATGGAESSEEHTSEIQSLMRSSSAVFCLKKQTT